MEEPDTTATTSTSPSPEAVVRVLLAEGCPKANAWLTRLADSSDGWQAGLGLLASAEPAVRQFGVTLLCLKAQRDRAQVREGDVGRLEASLLAAAAQGVAGESATLGLYRALARVLLWSGCGRAAGLLQSAACSSLPLAHRLLVLRTLAEECPPGLQGELARLCLMLLPRVAREATLDRQPATIALALQACKAWAGSGLGLTFANLGDLGLFEFVMSAIEDPALLGHTCELVVQLCTGGEAPRWQAGAPELAEGDGRLFSDLLMCMMGGRARNVPVLQLVPEGEGDLRRTHFVSAYAALGSRCERLIWPGGSEASAYFQLGATLIAELPELPLVEAALEPFLALAEAGPGACEPAFRVAVVGQLLPVLLHRCRVPPDAKALDDARVALRRSSRELLQSAACFLRADVVACIDAEMLASWQGLECALFAIGCVARELFPRPMQVRGRTSPTAEFDVPEQFHRVLAEVFSRAFSDEATAIGPLRSTALTTAGTCASWLKQNRQQLEQTLLVAIKGLGDPDGEQRLVAGDVIRILCCACPWEASQLKTAWPALLQAAKAICHDQCAKPVFEGIVRTLSFCPSGVATEYLQHLSAALTFTLQACLESQDANHAATVSAQVVGTAARMIRFLDDLPPAQEGAPAPILAVLSALWPGVKTVTAKFASHAPLVEAVCELCCGAIKSGREAVGSMLSDVVAVVTELFLAFPDHACCFEVLIAVAETYQSDPSLPSALAPVLQSVTGALGPVLTDVSQHPDLVASCLDLFYRCILYCPGAVDSCPNAEHVYQLSLTCLQQENRNPFRSACMLLQHGLDRSTRSLVAWLQGVGLDAFALGLCLALARAAPVDLSPRVALVAKSFVEQTRDDGLAALSRALAAVASEGGGSAERTAACEALLQGLRDAVADPRQMQGLVQSATRLAQACRAGAARSR